MKSILESITKSEFHKQQVLQNLLTRITDKKSAELVIKDLVDKGLDYYPDEDAKDIIWKQFENPNKTQLSLLDKIYNKLWDHLNDNIFDVFMSHTNLNESNKDFRTDGGFDNKKVSVSIKKELKILSEKIDKFADKNPISWGGDLIKILDEVKEINKFLNSNGRV